MLPSKLAGHLPLQEMIAAQLEGAKMKLASVEEEAEKKAKSKKEKMEEKKEKKEEAKEKMSSIDYTDPSDIEKLASALEFVAEKIAADTVETGAESRQGGTVLPTMAPVPGKQPYKHDKSKKHNIPTATGTISTQDNPGAATAVPTDDNRAPGGTGATYSAKGPFKTAAASVKDLIAKAKKKHEEGESEKEEEKEEKAKEKVSAEKDDEKGKDLAAGHRRVGAILGGLGGTLTGAAQGSVNKLVHGSHAPYGAATGALLGGALGAGTGYLGGHLRHWGAKHLAPKKEKKSSVDYILSKIAESAQGGLTLDSPSEEGPKPPTDGSNSARTHIGSNKAVIDMKKVQGKNPQKKQLSEVLTEPAQTPSTDSKVNENLRNASKGGVKIAAMKAYLSKVAAEACSCEGKGECPKCRLTAALEKRSGGQEA